MFLLVQAPLFSQAMETTIESEIAVSENAEIRVVGPKSVQVSGNGKIHIGQIKDKFVISGRDSDVHLYEIHKRVVINTWDKKSVKQVVTLRLQCETKAQQEELLAALDVEIKENAAGIVNIGGEMNIAKFQLENGWYKKDANSVVLDNGVEYPVQFLAISSEIFVPMASTLSLEAEDCDIEIDTHKGFLDLNLDGGTLAAGDLHDLKGAFASAEVKIRSVSQLNLTVQDAVVDVNEAKSATITSAISEITFDDVSEFTIRKSVQDNFSLGILGQVDVSNSTYSDYEVRQVTNGFNFSMSAGDLSIRKAGLDLKYGILESRMSKVHLGLGDLASYSLLCEPTGSSEFELPASLKRGVATGQQAEYTFGSNPERSKIDIKCKQCEVTIQD